MGVNNKQRRAAKKKAKQRTRPSGAWEPFVPDVTPARARSELYEVLASIDAEPAEAGRLAAELLRPDGPLPPEVAREALHALLGELTARVVAHGWLPSDLVRFVTRQLGEARVPTLVGLLQAETDRHATARVTQAWRDDLAAAGIAVAVDLRDVATVRAALQLATCLGTLPPIAVLVPPPGTAAGDSRPSDGGDPKLLARVRALLAKAESTEFDEEADALSAKAQELISRHALQRLLECPATGRPDLPVTRRIWIDPPYVFAKALLVDAAAEANHCRSVISEGLGFCTVIGDAREVAAVELLVASLLLQAGTAMRRHGRQSDRSGTSRTRSFRQSFLVSYAARVRERLQAAADDAVQGTGRAGELVPVLRDRAEQVRAVAEELFPHLVSRAASISNVQGWAAGRAAADLARLETAAPLTQAAS